MHLVTWCSHICLRPTLLGAGKLRPKRTVRDPLISSCLLLGLFHTQISAQQIVCKGVLNRSGQAWVEWLIGLDAVLDMVLGTYIDSTSIWILSLYWETQLEGQQLEWACKKLQWSFNSNICEPNKPQLPQQVLAVAGKNKQKLKFKITWKDRT